MYVVNTYTRPASVYINLKMIILFYEILYILLEKIYTILDLRWESRSGSLIKKTEWYKNIIQTYPRRNFVWKYM